MCANFGSSQEHVTLNGGFITEMIDELTVLHYLIWWDQY